MKTPLSSLPFFVFDVESIGIHGEAFAVAGGVYINGSAQSEFRFCCPIEEAIGDDDDRAWVKANVPFIEVSHRHPAAIWEAFWKEWEKAKARYPDITMAGECIWPVEASFILACVHQDLENRKWAGPYPFHDISSIMLAAGMDPMATYERQPSEFPSHEPLADARMSARLLATAIHKLETEKDRLRKALSGLVGAETKEELQGMAAIMRALPIPEKDAAVTLNAIHTLLDTQP